MERFHIFLVIFEIVLILQEIEPTPCPLGCGLEFKNPTSLDVHLKNVHSVTKQQIKQAQRIPMANPKDFLLVLGQDNVMCFTAGGCNTKLSCLSSARRHYNKRHPQTGSGEPGMSTGMSPGMSPGSSGGQMDYSSINPGAMQFNPSTGTFKQEPGVAGMSSSPGGIIPGPPKNQFKKKIKTNFGTPSPKKASFGTPPKKASFGGPPPKNQNFGMAPGAPKVPTVPEHTSNIDVNISKMDGEGAMCNVCGKAFTNVGNARRHYKTTHEVIYLIFFT